MCSIVGAVLHGLLNNHHEVAADTLQHLFAQAYQRGRDGRGFVALGTGGYQDSFQSVEEENGPTPGSLATRSIIPGGLNDFRMVSNYRAEPTTEYVMDKNPDDQQPYSLNGWHIAHNGTIANDKELRTVEVPTDIDSAAIVELLAQGETGFSTFINSIRKLKGSFAILAMHKNRSGTMYAAANYRPIWYSVNPEGVYFASCRTHFPTDHVPQMMPPYTIARFSPYGLEDLVPLHTIDADTKSKALVICSGGLDSTVAATACVDKGYEVELLHFQYGSRAEGPEVEAVHDVAEALGVPVRFLPVTIYDPADSPLLRDDSEIAGGEEGAEFAHEWVPARNLVLLSMATAYAEAKGFDVLVLGNNLEEAGAYPDNEPEFIAKFNDLLPFAVGDGKRLRVEMPVGNLMKHEIVALGHQVGAPMDKTWSCYRAGEKHCGTCGPCFMRRAAFEINGLDEVITYENEE